jgi:hypothetical protein
MSPSEFAAVVFRSACLRLRSIVRCEAVQEGKLLDKPPAFLMCIAELSVVFFQVLLLLDVAFLPPLLLQQFLLDQVDDHGRSHL